MVETLPAGRPRVPRHRPRLRARCRRRGRAVPARRGRGLRVGGVVVLVGRPAGLPRARRHGRRRRAWPPARCGLSLGPTTTDAEVDLALAAVPAAVARLPASGLAVRVLVGMSGGVDSSVAAADLRDDGHDVAGVTLKLWGGESDTGCCSVADVDDARRAADRLGVEHHVFNFGAEFDEQVVAPYVAAHAEGRTPNPCVECNRHVKFDLLLRRALALGFDAVATGHHARVVERPRRHPSGRPRRRCRPRTRATSSPCSGRTSSPAPGSRSAAGPRPRCGAGPPSSAWAPRPSPTARRCASSVAARAGRASSAPACRCTPGRVVDSGGAVVGAVDAVELVTVGQRRGHRAARAATIPATCSTSTSPPRRSPSAPPRSCS